ncbi:hypothetical protein D3C78_505640 [compost metagenome]
MKFHAPLTTVAVPISTPLLIIWIVLPVTPVPLSVGVASLVTCPGVKLPNAPPATLSLTVFSTGTAGGVMSMTTVYALDAMLTLPCGSVALTVKVCEPSLRAAVGVNVHAPLLLAVAVPICVAPSKMAMMLLASAVPESVGVVSLVTPLVGIFSIVPTLSSAPTITGVVEIVSTTIVNAGESPL